MIAEPESNPKALQRVEDERVKGLHAFMARVRAWTPIVAAAADDAANTWFELDHDYQELILKADRNFEADRSADLQAWFKDSADGLLHPNEI